MLAIDTGRKITFVDSTTIIKEDDGTWVLIAGKWCLVHGENILNKIREALRRGDNYLEVE